MKLNEFLKIQSDDMLNIDLIDTHGGIDCNANWLWNHIHSKVQEWVAVNEPEDSIKKMIEGVVDRYEIKTKKIENKSKELMKKWGFEFAED